MAAVIEREAVEAGLRAYIHPNVPGSFEQEAALDEAIDAQLAFETERAGGELPGGVASLTIGSYSVKRADAQAGTTPSGVCPSAWAILYNAGLLRRELPVAKRL